jgi:hypothetical protein
LLVSACLAILGSGYTLDGQWALTNQHLKYTSSNPNVTLSFVNNIVTTSLLMAQDTLGGSSTNVAHKGTAQLTVYACKTLTYNYYITENRIYLQEIRRSSDVRSCLPGEIQELEWRLNTTFYFTIQKNQLVLNDSSTQPSLVLNRVDGTSNNGYEAYTIKTINGKAFPGNNESQIYAGAGDVPQVLYFCDFQGEANYTQATRNNFNATILKDKCKNQ